MDENCLCQFKVVGMKFWLGLAQVNQGGLQSRASQLTVTGNERRSIIVGCEEETGPIVSAPFSDVDQMARMA